MTGWPTVPDDEPVATARERLETSGAPAVLVLDRAGAPRRWATTSDLERASSLDTAGTAVTQCVRLHVSLADVLDELLRSQAPGVAVVNGDGRHAGVVDMAAILRAGRRMHTSADTAELSSGERVSAGAVGEGTL